jgi:glycosyltransferase involved in cell wall biosynthesis
MVRRVARKRLSAFRRAFGQTRWAQAVRRRRRERLRIPPALPPDPALLPEPPREGKLPPELRDRRLVAAALAWSHGRAASEATARAPDPERGSRPLGARHGRIENVLFISHCDFSGHSALHAYRIASELHDRGRSPVIAVPDDPETVEDVGRPPFAVITYGDARAGRFGFPNGAGPDLIHAFSPRERVRELVARIVPICRCPYVVHLEDNDRAVLAAELGSNIEDIEALPPPLLDRFIRPGQVHPHRGSRFVERAAGATVVIDRLLELVPHGIPAAVVRPGIDEAVLAPSASREKVRAELGIRPEDTVVVYTGTIHAANLEDMRSLYDALAALRREGNAAVLVKTGWNAPDAPELPALDGGMRDIGWVPRHALPGIIAAADVLVQPGHPGPFNDYRFPAKLPDFLASGKPVILTRTNIGLALRHGHDAIVLEHGTADEIHRAITSIRTQPDVAAAIGAEGRRFALQELRWSKSVDAVEALYDKLAASGAPAQPQWALEVEPPVRIVALLPKCPEADEAQEARRQGVFAFCFPHEGAERAHLGEFPFCFRIRRVDDAAIEKLRDALALPGYLTVAGAPLLVCDDGDDAVHLRGVVEAAYGGHVHLALIESAERPADLAGLDSLVEEPEAPESRDLRDSVMKAHLSAELRPHVWFRSVAADDKHAGNDIYGMWLRKLVLQALGRANAHEPIVFVDPRGVWEDAGAREAWLNATHAALRDGVWQLYVSRRLDVKARSLDEELRLA